MEQDLFDAITKALAKWIANSSRPTNVAMDEGLQDVIHVAANKSVVQTSIQTSHRLTC